MLHGMVFMKTLSIILTVLLISCGKPTRFEHPDVSKSTEEAIFWPAKKLPITIKVPKEKFEKFQEIYTEVQEEYEEAAGKPLIKFIADDKNIALKNFSESKAIKGSNYLMFKEDDKNFLDLIFPTMGITQVVWMVPSMQIFQAHIVINFSKGEMELALFKEVLLHELGHFLGFNHVANEDSIMGEFIDHSLPGLRDFDIDRIKKKYSRPVRNSGVARL
jgi:predicted Zn-dependent protease